jgi:hypothetical protein
MTTPQRRVVDRLRQLVADAEKRLDKHVALIDRFKGGANRQLANALLRQYLTALDLLRGRLDVEERERTEPLQFDLFSRPSGRRIR